MGGIKELWTNLGDVGSERRRIEAGENLPEPPGRRYAMSRDTPLIRLRQPNAIGVTAMDLSARSKQGLGLSRSGGPRSATAAR